MTFYQSSYHVTELIMSFLCDTCGKVYKHKRNLKGHVEEKHLELPHWCCVESDCSSRFIRRSYLFHHLMTIHHLSKDDARNKTIFAIRANKETEAKNDSYYDAVSDDDNILDIFDGDVELTSTEVNNASGSYSQVQPCTSTVKDYSDISSDEDVIFVRQEFGAPARADNTVRHIRETYTISLERNFTYRGNELIHYNQFIFKDRIVENY